MSLVKDGSTALGFVCDVKGCGCKATHTPLLCVPFEGLPVEIKTPVMVFIYNQVCMEHRKDVKESDMLFPGMRRKVRDLAAAKGGKPDFDRAYPMFFPCISAEYQDFLEKIGLVEPGDAQAKGTLILPEGITLN